LTYTGDVLNVNDNWVNESGDTMTGPLDMGGSDVVLGNGATGTAKVQGSRELYAGDETEVTTDSSSYVLKKEMTMVFDSDFGHKPRYVNVIARIRNADLRVNISSLSNTVSTTSDTYVLRTMTFDVSGFSDDSTYSTTVELRTNGGTAYHDIIEFYYVL
ncbi:MAG: hypothetical protein ABEJ72_11180, partial [Candidatus Aenigmatarchaeota archaeon]